MLLLVETSRLLRTGRSSARAYSKQSGVPVLVSALWYKLVLLRVFGYWFKGHVVSGWPLAVAVPSLFSSRLAAGKPRLPCLGRCVSSVRGH